MSEKRSHDKPTPELSADLFLQTALQLAEQSGGAQKLSLRNLGKALGVDATAVYRYFPSKAALVDAMMKHLAYDFLPHEDEMQGDWRAMLTALARRAHYVFSTYPSLSIHLP
ncbi:MAG: helix-turn-helix domain-containing protein, partial [Chloroflexota bacterium]